MSPKVSKPSSTARRSRTVAVILSLSEIMPLCSCCVKEGLVYVAIAAPSSRQPSSCSGCTSVNMRLSCDVCLVSDAKCTRPITLNSRLVPSLICLRVLCSICCCKTR